MSTAVSPANSPAAARVSTLPDFLCLGTYRAGTTWLHKVLESHPQICLPIEKELMFFSHQFEAGLDWYASCFAHRPEARIRGEICPTYLSSREASARIYAALPNAKLIVILRRPVEQVQSLYKLWVVRGTAKADLLSTVQSEPEFLDNVQYYAHLARYLHYFSREQMLVLLYDDLEADPYAFLRTVYRFLGVDDYFPDVVAEQVNGGRKARLPVVEHVMVRIADFLKRQRLHGLKQLVKKSGLVDLIRGANIQAQPRAAVDSDLEQLVIKGTRTDVEQLEKFLGRNLDPWR